MLEPRPCCDETVLPASRLLILGGGGGIGHGQFIYQPNSCGERGEEEGGSEGGGGGGKPAFRLSSVHKTICQDSKCFHGMLQVKKYGVKLLSSIFL